MKRTNVLEKLRLLKIHEEEDRKAGRTGEADNFLAGIKRQMRRHGITQKQLDDYIQKNDVIEPEVIFKGKTEAWHEVLLSGIAQVNDSRGGGNGERLICIGTRANRARIKRSFEHFCGVIEDLVATKTNVRPFMTETVDHAGFSYLTYAPFPSLRLNRYSDEYKLSFMHGAAVSIQERLVYDRFGSENPGREEQENPENSDVSGLKPLEESEIDPHALVVTEKELPANAYLREKGISEAAQPEVGHRNGFLDGLKAGMKVNLSEMLLEDKK